MGTVPWPVSTGSAPAGCCRSSPRSSAWSGTGNGWNAMRVDEAERLRRWRLVLGSDAACTGGSGIGAGEGLDVALSGVDAGMDRVLGALYDSERQAGLGGSAPKVNRWLGDIRTYFPTPVVRVMQQDALERLGLRQMLLEPELLQAVEPDVHLVATLLSLSRVIPERTKETARGVVRKVVDELERKLRNKTVQAVRGSLNRAARTSRPRPNEIDWDRTIRANLKHYQPDRATIIPEKLIGYGHKRQSLRDIVLCVDQSGSMANSVVYSGIFGAVLASIRAVSTRMVVFDTAVVDLTDDLYEGGNAAEMLKRIAALVASGVQLVCLLALNDGGAPIYDERHAPALAGL